MKKRLLSIIALVALLSVGLYAVTALTAHAAPAERHVFVVRATGPTATASFSGTDEATGTSWEVEISISTQSIQQPPGKPTTGSSVQIFIAEFNTEGVGFFAVSDPTTAPSGMTIDGKNLNSAFFPATEMTVHPTQDDPTLFEPFNVAMGPISWTGEGAIRFSSQTFHFRIPGIGSESGHTSGASRNATAIGSFSFDPSVSLPGFNSVPVNVTDAAQFAGLDNGRFMLRISSALGG